MQEPQYLFLLRHGESSWNHAKASSAFERLKELSHVDHPLSPEGVRQAKRFNRAWRGLDGLSDSHLSDLMRDPEKSLMSTALESPRLRVLSSPLTRALSTALIALHGHPAMHSRPVVLTKKAREVKSGLANLDCVSTVTGSDIFERTKHEIAAAVGETEAAQLCGGVGVDSSECGDTWWTRTYDSQAEVSKRCRQLLALVSSLGKSSGSGLRDPVLIAGHSGKFLALCRQLVPEEGRLMRQSPELARRLRSTKLDNAACLGLRIEFFEGQPQITQARLLFGSFKQDPNAPAAPVSPGGALNQSSSGLTEDLRASIRLSSSSSANMEEAISRESIQRLDAQARDSVLGWIAMQHTDASEAPVLESESVSDEEGGGRLSIVVFDSDELEGILSEDLARVRAHSAEGKFARLSSGQLRTFENLWFTATQDADRLSRKSLILYAQSLAFDSEFFEQSIHALRIQESVSFSDFVKFLIYNGAK